MATATLTADEEYARKLQEEYNNASSGGRATRGGASRTTKKTKRGKASTSKAAASEKGSSKRYGSKAYIDDSDLDGEERSNSRGDSDESASDAAPKKKKRKASSGGGGGTGGGYNKELALSEPLQKVCGVPTVSAMQCHDERRQLSSHVITNSTYAICHSCFYNLPVDGIFA